MDLPSTTTPEMLLLIDCDPGVDDCIALMMAFAQSPRVKIVGITCANGNVGLRQVTLNAVRTVKLYDMLDEVPVYKGCEDRMVEMPRSADSTYYHGKDGLGDVPDVEPRATDQFLDHVQDEHAVHAIIRLSKQYAGRLQMLCLGAVTNLAIASKLDPDLPKRLKSLHIMGGAIRGFGNVTPAAEYNFLADPEAAYTVFRSFPAPCPTQLVAYEVTLDAAVPPDWFKRIVSGTDKRSTFFREVSGHSLQFQDRCIDAGLASGYSMCDTYLVAIVLDPSAVKKSKRVRMTVETGGMVSRGSLIVDHMNKGSPFLSPAPVELIEEIDVDVYKNLVAQCFSQN